MKKLLIATVVATLVSGSLLASNIPDIKKALFIKIEKNVSNTFIGNMKKKAKQKKIPMVINPKFTCTDAGFKQKDLFAQGTMYGTNRADGSIEINGKGAFKAYRYKRYIQGKRECRETSYTKKYDPERFGNQSYAVIMMP